MEKTLFEQMGGTYRQVGDYLLPDIELPDEPEAEIGVRGQRHLKQHPKLLYTNLFTSGKLNSHLAEIDNQADEMCEELTKRLAKQEKITEKLRAEDQMAWVSAMNNIQKPCK